MTGKKLMPPEQALPIILSSLPEMGSESVRLEESRGRVVFEDIVAGENIPKYANSSMDGFAILDRDTVHASQTSPVQLRIIGESAAGSPFQKVLSTSGDAVRIMTGGIVPDGANAVIELERVDDNADTITITQPVPRGKNIRLAAEDVRRGECVVQKGTILEPEHIGILASVGFADVGVSRKPSVAVITTGSELVDPRGVPGPGQVRNSSGFMLPAYVEEAGGHVMSSRTVGDDEALLADILIQSLSEDVVITTGGISAGKYDLVRKVLESIGVTLKFSGVNIKPGKPLTYGVANNGTPVFCLPGNPVSSAVTFWRFVRPAFDQMMGRRWKLKPYCRAELQEDIVKKDTKEHYLRGIFTVRKDIPAVRLTGTQSSGALSSMSKANCLVVLPAEARVFPAGEIVEIQLL